MPQGDEKGQRATRRIRRVGSISARTSYEDRRDVVCNSGVGSLRNTVMQLVEAGESS